MTDQSYDAVKVAVAADTRLTSALSVGTGVAFATITVTVAKARGLTLAAIAFTRTTATGALEVAVVAFGHARGCSGIRRLRKRFVGVGGRLRGVVFRTVAGTGTPKTESEGQQQS